MKKKAKPSEANGPRPEYDFRGGQRGKYAKQFATETNLVAIDPDVFEHFRDTETINQVLRASIQLADKFPSRRAISKSKK